MSLNIRITENPDGGRSIEIGETPAPAEIPSPIVVYSDQQLRAAMAGVAPASGHLAFAAAAAAARPRFIKISAAGEALPADASSWSAVHDTTSGLIWSAENAAAKRLTHAKAVAACESLDLAGKGGWRLPTRTELLTLVDDTRHEPATDTAFFPKTESNWYWTSTPCAWRPGSAAWCVYFGGGGVYGFGHDFECFVRAVRVASPAAGQ